MIKLTTINMKLYRHRKYITLLLSISFGILSSYSQEMQDSVVNSSTSMPERIDTNQGDSTLYFIESDQVVIPPLFEYIVAPDDLPDLQSRTDYLMDNFWSPFDFKKNKYVDQNALNHAFDTYVHAMPFASEKKVKESVKNLIKNLKGNPGLSLQFTKAAEQTLYGPHADFWADDIYISFLQNLIDNKKIDSSKKKRYIDQLDLLKRTAVGSVMPEVNLTTTEGTLTKLRAPKEFRIIEFTYPSCEDCHYSNVKLDISGIINDLIEDGRLEVIVVTMDYPVKENYFPQKWISLSSDNAKDILDIRVYPCFYIVDKDNKIVAKNLSVDTAIEYLEVLSKEKKK